MTPTTLAEKFEKEFTAHLDVPCEEVIAWLRTAEAEIDKAAYKRAWQDAEKAIRETLLYKAGYAAGKKQEYARGYERGRREVEEWAKEHAEGNIAGYGVLRVNLADLLSFLTSSKDEK